MAFRSLIQPQGRAPIPVAADPVQMLVEARAGADLDAWARQQVVVYDRRAQQNEAELHGSRLLTGLGVAATAGFVALFSLVPSGPVADMPPGIAIPAVIWGIVLAFTWAIAVALGMIFAAQGHFKLRAPSRRIVEPIALGCEEGADGTLLLTARVGAKTLSSERVEAAADTEALAEAAAVSRFAVEAANERIDEAIRKALALHAEQAQIRGEAMDVLDHVLASPSH